MAALSISAIFLANLAHIENRTDFAKFAARRHGRGDRKSNRLLDEAGLESDRNAIDAAGDFMVTIDELDRLRFGAALEHLRAAQLEVLRQHHAVAIGEDIAMRVPHHPRSIRRFRRLLARPLMPARHAFPFRGKFQHVRHLTHRAGRVGHGKGTLAISCAELQLRGDCQAVETNPRPIFLH